MIWDSTAFSTLSILKQSSSKKDKYFFVIRKSLLDRIWDRAKLEVKFIQNTEIWNGNI